MNIFGKKVILRAIEEMDLQFLKDIHNDPEIEKWIGGWSFPLSMKNQEIWFEKLIMDKSTIRLIIEDQVHHEHIGLTGLWNIDWKNSIAYTGIMLVNNNKFRRKGYGTDALMALMRYSFEELNLRKLESDIIEYNKSSLSLYIEKCGWKKEGVQRKHVFRANTTYDRVLIGILKEEYLNLAKKTHYWK